MIIGGFHLVASAQWQLWHPHSHSIRYSGCASYVASVWVAIGVASCGTRPCQARGLVCLVNNTSSDVNATLRGACWESRGARESKGEHRLLGLSACWLFVRNCSDHMHAATDAATMGCGSLTARDMLCLDDICSCMLGAGGTWCWCGRAADADLSQAWLAWRGDIELLCDCDTSWAAQPPLPLWRAGQLADINAGCPRPFASLPTDNVPTEFLAWVSQLCRPFVPILSATWGVSCIYLLYVF